MLLGPDHVADLHVEVVDYVRQVVGHGAVGALDHGVLFGGPGDGHIAANVVEEAAGAFARHQQLHGSQPALGLEAGAIAPTLRHPLAAINLRPLLLLGQDHLGLRLLGLRVVPVSEPLGEQLLNRFLVAFELLRLVVRPVRAANFRAFVPVQAEPAEAVQDRLKGFLHVALLVGVVDAKDELPTVLLGEEVVEQGGADAADVEVARGARCEARAYSHDDMI